MAKGYAMVHKHLLVLLLLPLLLMPGSAVTGPSPDYDPNVLSYGIYWFGRFFQAPRNVGVISISRAEWICRSRAVCV